MKFVFILLPLAAYILLTLSFSRKPGGKEILNALLTGHILIFTFITLSTEFLSLIQEISFLSILFAWLLFLLLCGIALFGLRRENRSSLPRLDENSRLTKMLHGGTVFILAATFFTAVVFPPNNWDSMTYHMARVSHWISNSSVSFYPTAISRQLYQMPLAEYAIMHVQILTNSDLYANLVQWINFLVMICLGFLIAAELGHSRRQQTLSAFMIAFLPMAILQASSTQNDLVVSCFLMSFALFMLRINKNITTKSLLFASLSLGLALLTKGTAFIYGAAIGICLAIPLLLARRHDSKEFFKAIAALSFIVCTALFLNTGHFWRNYQLYGQPLPTEEARYRNEDVTVKILMSNILRNGALHLGTPSGLINRYQHHAMQAILDAELNNPKTTWPGRSFSIQYTQHEDTAGNLIHMFIAIFCMISLPVLWFRYKQYRKTIWYAFGIIFGTLLYSLLLKWQPWASRLHTPLFALAAPLLAISIAPDNRSPTKTLTYLVCFCTILYSLPFVLANSSRSIVSLEWYESDRAQLYFKNRSELFEGYSAVTNLLGDANGEDVGLYLDVDDWEYPLWALAGQAAQKESILSFHHIGVRNISESINVDRSLPLYVIVTIPIDTWEFASNYAPVYISEHISLYKRF